MPATLGLNCTLTVDGTVVKGAKDVTVNLEGSEVDVTPRGATWKQTQLALKEATIEAEIHAIDDADTVSAIGSILSAYSGGSTISVSAAAGGHTVSGEFYVTKVSRKEPLEDVVSYSVTFKSAGAITAS
jgi:predicted secreted protein